MEEKVTTTTPTPEIETTNTICLNEEAIKSLKSIVKWSHIFVIVTYVALGIMLVFMLALGKFFDKAIYLTGQPIPPNFNTIFYSLYGIVMIVVYFFPLLYLQKFSKKAKQALAQKDEILMGKALEKQSVFFQIIAWYTIVSTFFMLVFFVGFTLILFFVQ